MMETAILGTGSIALGMAALLAEAGHGVTLWSPSGKLEAGTMELQSTGVVVGTFAVRAAASAEAAIAGAEAIILAVPGYGHRNVIEAAAPHLRAGQTFIISSHCSFSALYLSHLLAGSGRELPVVALGTTIVSGRRTGPASVTVSNVRQRLDAATLPTHRSDAGLATCRALFGDRFEPRSDVLAISLSNLNPQNHMAIALCNLTRIEKGEAWGNYAGITGAVGRLIEALDLERLTLAASLGLTVRSVQDHFHLSFDVPRGSIAEMAAAIDARGGTPNGPTSLDTRYVHEDVPFGLVVTEAIGRVAGIATPLHTAGIELFSGLYGVDFRAANDLLPLLGIEQLTPTDLSLFCQTGVKPRSAAA
jgi:opine dehydrogenase